MAYVPPPQGRGDRRLNSTNYEHPQETNLLDVARAFNIAMKQANRNFVLTLVQMLL